MMTPILVKKKACGMVVHSGTKVALYGCSLELINS